MIPINNREGKILIQKIPQYVKRTSHKTYYLTESKKALSLLDKLRNKGSV